MEKRSAEELLYEDLQPDEWPSTRSAWLLGKLAMVHIEDGDTLGVYAKEALRLSLAAQTPPRPATISLSRVEFAQARETIWSAGQPKGLAPSVSVWHRVNNDLAAADALLAAAGLAWAPEAGEGRPEPDPAEGVDAKEQLGRVRTMTEREFKAAVEEAAGSGWSRSISELVLPIVREAGLVFAPDKPIYATEEQWRGIAGGSWGRIRPESTVAGWQGPWTDRPPSSTRPAPATVSAWVSGARVSMPFEPGMGLVDAVLEAHCTGPIAAAERARLAEARRRHEAREAEFAEARRQEADAALGARMRELLSDTAFAPPELVTLLQFAEVKSPNHLASLTLAWLRQQAGLAGGEEAGQAARLPEQIDWVLDELVDGRCELRLLAPAAVDAKAVYAEAVRRYNLHGRLRELVVRWQAEDGAAETGPGKWSAAGELLSALAEGRPNG